MPAFITSVGGRSVMVSVFAPDNRGSIPYDGVRHISDPELSDNPDRSSGCWDYTPDQIRLGVAEEIYRAMLTENADLQRQISELKTLIGA